MTAYDELKCSLKFSLVTGLAMALIAFVVLP